MVLTPHDLDLMEVAIIDNAAVLLLHSNALGCTFDLGYSKKTHSVLTKGL